MTGQQKIIEGIRKNPAGLKPVFQKFYDLYYTEFKGQWIEKELKEATKYLTENSFFNCLDGEFDNDELADELEELFDEIEKEKKTDLFIGLRSVSTEQFKLYSKGLYFMAAYRLLIKQKS